MIDILVLWYRQECNIHRNSSKFQILNVGCCKIINSVCTLKKHLYLIDMDVLVKITNTVGQADFTLV